MFNEKTMPILTINFTDGSLSSGAGVLLLKVADDCFKVISGLAACFTNHHAPGYLDFTLEELLAQHIYGLAAGYEDLNDHDQQVDFLLGLAHKSPD